MYVCVLVCERVCIYIYICVCVYTCIRCIGVSTNKIIYNTCVQ